MGDGLSWRCLDVGLGRAMELSVVQAALIGNSALVNCGFQRACWLHSQPLKVSEGAKCEGGSGGRGSVTRTVQVRGDSWGRRRARARGCQCPPATTSGAEQQLAGCHSPGRSETPVVSLTLKCDRY